MSGRTVAIAISRARPALGALVATRTGALLTAGAGWLYLVAGQSGAPDQLVPLARTFLAGRLYLADPMPWLELIPRVGGGWYVPFPPIPSLLFVPILWLFPGLAFDTCLAAAIAGAVSVLLIWRILGQLGLAFRPRLALAAGYALGSELVWVAAVGGPHLWVQVVGETFLLGVLTLALERRWPILGGALFAAASVGARLPIIGAAPLLLGLYAGFRWSGLRGRDVRRFVLGALPIAAAVAWYNLARFGSPLEFGYGPLIASDPWFPHGLLSPLYLPRGLYALLFQGFGFVDQFPWLKPGWTGEAVTFTMPVVLMLWQARSREPFVILSWAAIAAILLPDLTHGSWGFAQYGYRFVLDALPIIWLLLAWIVRREGLGHGTAILLGLGVAAQLYGLVAIWVLRFVS